MAFPGLHGVDPRGVHTAVAQQVRQTHDVLFDGVKRPGEKVPQIVGVYLAPRHLRPFTQPLHTAPDIAAVQRLAVSPHKYWPGLLAGFFYISQQQLLQLRRKKMQQQRNLQIPQQLRILLHSSTD